MAEAPTQNVVTNTGKIDKPLNTLEELVTQELINRAETLPQTLWDEERGFGLRLKNDGSWERHPRRSLKDGPRQEASEPRPGSIYDDAAGYGDKPIRTLTDFALYDEQGRPVPVEALELQGTGKIVAYGTLVPPRKVSKASIQVPPPADKLEDSYASAVIVQPPPVEVFEATGPVGEDGNLELYELRSTLEELVITPITVDALKQTGLGKMVNLLRRHPDLGVFRRACAVKYAWADLLDRGGSDPASVDSAFLQQAATRLDECSRSIDLEKLPHRPTTSRKAFAPTIDDEEMETGNEDHGEGQQRKRARHTSPVSGGGVAADVVAEYRWNGKEVEPSGPQELRLKQMIDYVRELLQCTDEELTGWRMTVHRRKKGTAFGQIDSYFFSPEGKRYRSRNEVGKAVEAGTFGVPRSRAPRAISSTPARKATQAVKVIMPMAPPESAPSPVFFDDFAETDICEARRPPYEYRMVPPTILLSASVERPQDPSRAEVLARADDETGRNGDANGSPLRVKLDLIGWSISVEYGGAALYVHTDVAAYRLAGDQVVARPSRWYYPFFCNAFLTLEACRLIVRSLVDYSSVFPLPKLEFAEIMADVLQRSRRCPGGEGHSRLIVPSSAVRFYYYADSSRLTADFVVSRQPIILALARRHFLKNLNLVSGTPFFADLMLEFDRRSKQQGKAVEIALIEEQKRRANEKRKALRMENKEKEKILALAKKLEESGDLLPDDTLLMTRDSLMEVARLTTSDPLMVQALEKMLSKIELPAVSRPVPLPLEFDPALLNGPRMLEIIESGNLTLGDAMLPSLPKSNGVNGNSLAEPERALLSGSLMESQPVVHPEEFGEMYARELHLWEGACLFARGMGKNEEEFVGSFAQFRKQLHESGMNCPLFAQMLQAVARQDNLKQNPALPSTEDLCFHLALDPAQDEAYDLTVWPLPDWLVDQNTWPAVLKSALCDWLRRNPEVAVLEALECGEIHDFGATPGLDASLALREQAAPRDLDFIALCDDGLRRLLLDPDADEFSRPVDRVLFPDYDQVIARPMDIGTIRARIANGHYNPERAPVGAYEWDSEKLGISGKEQEALKVDGAESDDDEDDDERPSFNLLELLADYRTGGALPNADKRPDCGKCKHCLDKPRFGGYNILRLPCIVKQQAEQLQAGSSSRDAKKGRTKELWKRRQAALAKEEAMAKFDEMYYTHDSLGGGHEGIAADVRLVFRNCRVYNKGTTPIYRAASKLDSMFGAYYLRFVASRDRKYALPRLFGLPEAIIRDAKRFTAAGENGETSFEDEGIVPRIRRSFPSLISTVRAFSEAKDLSLVEAKAKLVAMGWLVDRALETIPSEFFNSFFASNRGANVASNTDSSSSTAHLARLFEPTGITRDYLRVWATPHLIRETGGLVMLEDLRTGHWSYFEDLTQFEAFVGSLDRRGKREHALKKALEANLEDIKQVIGEAGHESVNASKELKAAQADLQQATEELASLQQLLPEARVAADNAKASVLHLAQERHRQDEETRKQEVDRKRRLWAEARTEDGKPYYYHVETRATTWTRPKEMDLKFQSKPMPPVSDVTPQEMHLNQLLVRAEEVSANIGACEARVHKAKASISRDRAVLMLAKKLKLAPRPDAEDAKKQGFLRTTSALIASILCVEHICLGPDADEFMGKNISWPQSPQRAAWVVRLRELAAVCGRSFKAEECFDNVISVMKESLLTIWDVFTQAEPGATVGLGSFLRQALLAESWRWRTSLKTAKNLSDISVLLGHLRRFLLAKLGTPQAQAWERAMEKELIANCSL